MDRCSSITKKVFAVWYMNNVFDSKHMVFHTNIITLKYVKFKRILRRLREAGSWSFFPFRH